jgi:O-antigen/teichoic acid export membrane protein
LYNLVTQYINPLFAKFNKSKIRRLSKEGGIILLGQANSILTSLILVRLLTETLLPAEYGKLSLALSVGPFVCQIAFAVSMPGIGRYFALAIERVKQYEFYKASMQMMLYSTIISITLIIVLLFGFEYFDIINMKVIVTMSILYLIISNYNTIFTEFQNVARQRHIAVFHSFLDSWLKIGLVFLLVHFFFNKAETIVTAYIFS